MITNAVEFAEELIDTYLDAKGREPYGTSRVTLPSGQKIISKIYNFHGYETGEDDFEIKISSDGVNAAKVIHTVYGSDGMRETRPVENITVCLQFCKNVNKERIL
jgi:hypothetical protein